MSYDLDTDYSLPFSTTAETPVEIVDFVLDDRGNTIQLPKKLCLDWIEQKVLGKLQQNLQSDPQNIQTSEYRCMVVILMLSFRLKINSEFLIDLYPKWQQKNKKVIPTDAILRYPDKTPFTQKTIEKLYEFFEQEITRGGSISPDFFIPSLEDEQAQKKLIQSQQTQMQKELMERLIGQISSGDFDISSLQKIASATKNSQQQVLS